MFWICLKFGEILQCRKFVGVLLRDIFWGFIVEDDLLGRKLFLFCNGIVNQLFKYILKCICKCNEVIIYMYIKLLLRGVNKVIDIIILYLKVFGFF